jgi:hypothetical protein
MLAEETPTMNIFEKIRLISEYAPLLTYLQQLSAADEMTDKVGVAADAAEWIASKTEMEWDDEVVSLVADILRSDEGAALIEWIVEKMKDGPA